jgi:tetratricopeptide (TPR) repeat protein
MLGKHHDQLLAKADDLHQRGLFLFCQDRFREAQAAFEEEVKLIELVYGTDHIQLREALNELGYTLEAAKRFVEAEPVRRRLLAHMENNFGSDSNCAAHELDRLVENLIEQGKLCEALGLARRSSGIRVRVSSPDAMELVQTYLNLGRILMLRGDRRKGGKRRSDYEEAESHFRNCLMLVGERDLSRSAICLFENFSELLQRLGMNQEARRLSVRAAACRREAERRWRDAAKW